MKRAKKVFVAMSGGVDSSVAALLLKKQYDVVGVFMRSYNLDGCQDRDARDARLVAQKIGIPFYVWDFEKEYKKRVVDYMISGYKRGITPNPDVMCNKEIKFGLFLDKALKQGADFIATGHYVRIKNGKLYEAKDKNKDQTYFLWTLTEKQLMYCLFPIGDYLKPDVRVIAKKAGLPTANKKDSQGICFLGKVSLSDFLKKRIPKKNGSILNTAGKEIGEHDGSHFYTIGQRHGLNLGDKSRDQKNKGKTETKPYYVVEKDVKNNSIVVASGDDNPALYKKEIYLEGVNFMRPFSRNKNKMSVFVRVRYRQPLAKATLILGIKTATAKSASKSLFARVRFDKSQKFIAPGQSAVFYSASANGEMLGGGVIL